MFIEFIKLNRNDTSRTPAKHSRYHGAVFYVSPKILFLKSKQELDFKSFKTDDVSPFIYLELNSIDSSHCSMLWPRHLARLQSGITPPVPQ